MSSVRSVGQVSVVIEGSPALVGGYGAWFLAYALREELSGGLEAVMARRGLSEKARLHVRHAAAALEAAALAYESLSRSTSSGGNEETQTVGEDASSDSWIGTAHASRLLGRSQRRVGQLAAGGDLTSRLRLGRLEVPQHEVLALRRARERSAA
jgi:hypothetical protein